MLVLWGPQKVWKFILEGPEGPEASSSSEDCDWHDKVDGKKCVGWAYRPCQQEMQSDAETSSRL